MSMDIHDVYRRLRHRLGRKKNWWPAESPFEVMAGAILTQNTAWRNVRKAIANLRAAESLNAESIAASPRAELAEIIRPSGYYNIKAERLQSFCAWYLNHGGYDGLAAMRTKPLRAAILSVRGVGPETADDIVLYAFGRPVFVIDAYTRRAFSRLGLIKGDENYETLRRMFENALPKSAALFAEYHALILHHGAHYCRKKPLCADCPLAADCPSKV